MPDTYTAPFTLFCRPPFLRMECLDFAVNLTPREARNLASDLLKLADEVQFEPRFSEEDMALILGCLRTYGAYSVGLEESLRKLHKFRETDE